MSNKIEKRISRFKVNCSEQNIQDQICEMRKQNQKMCFVEKRMHQFQIDEFDDKNLTEIDPKFCDSRLTNFQKLELIVYYLKTNISENKIIALLQLFKRFTLNEDFLFKLKDQNNIEIILNIIGKGFQETTNCKILVELTWILCNICFIS